MFHFFIHTGYSALHPCNQCCYLKDLIPQIKENQNIYLQVIMTSFPIFLAECCNNSSLPGRIILNVC